MGSQVLGSCAGGGGTQCTSVVNGPKATCEAVMDDTTGGTTPVSKIKKRESRSYVVVIINCVTIY